MPDLDKARALYYAAKLFRDGAVQLAGWLPEEPNAEAGRCIDRIMEILQREIRVVAGTPVPTVRRDDGRR